MLPLRIREGNDGPFKAKEVRLQCPHCLGSVFVPLPWRVTAEQRQRSISAAIDEHRNLCSAAPPEKARVYTIDYPRA